jgi:metal-responsive CopG/Arc/MetJ family transcriptional regulator
MPSDSPIEDPYVRISLELRVSTIDWLDSLKEEWGIRSRSDLISRLLDELKPPTDV